MSFVPGKSDAKKALRYRKRGIDALTPEQAEWLKGYEESLIARGVPRRTSKYTQENEESNTEAPEGGAENADETPIDREPAVPPVGTQNESGHIPPTPDDEVGAPPPPRPPRVATDSVATGGGKRQSGNWRERYSGGSSVDGREQTCLTIASQVIGVLQLMSDQIRLSGAEPVIEPKLLFNAMVLTVDDVLPQDLTVKPQHVAVGGSIAILTHRFLRRKEIADAVKKSNEQSEFAKKYGFAQSPPPPAPPPVPQPAPPPAPPPPPAVKVEPPRPPDTVYNDRDGQPSVEVY